MKDWNNLVPDEPAAEPCQAHQDELEALAKKMGDAGYCNYDACRAYLQKAYALGRASGDVAERAARIATERIEQFSRECILFTDTWRTAVRAIIVDELEKG